MLLTSSRSTSSETSVRKCRLQPEFVSWEIIQQLGLEKGCEASLFSNKTAVTSAAAEGTVLLHFSRLQINSHIQLLGSITHKKILLEQQQRVFASTDLRLTNCYSLQFSLIYTAPNHSSGHLDATSCFSFKRFVLRLSLSLCSSCEIRVQGPRYERVHSWITDENKCDPFLQRRSEK